MRYLRWSQEKNLELMWNRGIRFEDLLSAKFIGMEEHPKKRHQRYMVFEYRKYVWVVPFVAHGDSYFLKTAFPSRKHTKKYLRGD